MLSEKLVAVVAAVLVVATGTVLFHVVDEPHTKYVWAIIPALIGTGAAIAGGLINYNAASDASKRQAEQAELNRQMQVQFAQEGIRWKVDDARKAGIHPLYALGANTVSYSPVSIGSTPDTSLGSAVASAGQDLSRAMNATRTGPERDAAFTKSVQDLSLAKMGLENELLSSQIAKLRSTTNPPLPSLVPEADKYEERPRLAIGDHQVGTDPNVTNAEDSEKRYGEISDFIVGPYNLWRDYVQTMGAAEHNRRMNPFDGGRRKGLEGVFDDMRSYLYNKYRRNNWHSN